jgi:hypothetical protein
LSSERQLAVVVTYGDIRVEFSGSPELVIRSIHEFISKEIPSLDLARSISVNYSLNDLIQMFKEYIRITEEGPRVWAKDKKLSDKDLVSLQLIAAKVSWLSGGGNSNRPDGMTVGELEVATGLYSKTIGSRLSELNKLGHVQREDSEGTGRYKITTTGVHWLHGQLERKFPKQSSQATG